MNYPRRHITTSIALTFWCIATFLGVEKIAAVETPSVTSNNRPNIVLIMVDDMGFSDLGCYGGEIETPNLDALAKKGIRFTQFYNCAKCETTRSTLMSGRYYPEVKNTNLEDCVTLAEAMKLGDYTTLMTGKWHVKQTPVKRGFDKYFGHLSGATNFFVGDDTFRLQDEPFEVPKSGFYTTDAMADYAVKFLDESPKEKPFFLYVAFNAPHYPLQAPKESVEKYRGKYKTGWDELRKTRFEKQKQIGLFPKDTKLSPRPQNVPAWSEIDESDKNHHDLMMATFAGMIDRVDVNVGRIVEKLKAMNQLDNTLIMFLSDNGACPFQRSKKSSIENNLNPWDPNSFWCYDQRWAHACNTPLREYKQNQHEGGINTPMIAHWPSGISESLRGSFCRQPSHLVDMMATLVDLGEVTYPKTHNDKPVGPMRGISLKPIFEGKTRQPHEHLFFSFYGKNNAIRVGDWKLVNINFERWELYNIAKDRTELNDLAKSNPEKLAEMKAIWERVSQQVGEKKKLRRNNKKKNGKKNSKKKK